VTRALTIIVLLLLGARFAQADDALKQGQPWREHRQQQQLLMDTIGLVEQTCHAAHKYDFAVDSTNNLKIGRYGESKSITIDRSNALTGNSFFEDGSVRDLVDSDVRNCMKDQWKQVISTAEEGKIPIITLPSRMFAGPGQYPPREFKAYGVVAFNSLPTDADKDRYGMICNAYVSSLLYFKDVQAPLEKQMVTVWPIDNKDVALKVSTESREKVCADAVPHYGLSIAQGAILAARRNTSDLTGRGPFLLAWSPGATEGQTNVLVLVSDMSDVINNDQAKQILEEWERDITENPTLWDNGWNEPKLKRFVRLWADKWGSKALQILGAKS
jgi:hypothetical protein